MNTFSTNYLNITAVNHTLTTIIETKTKLILNFVKKSLVKEGI